MKSKAPSDYDPRFSRSLELFRRAERVIPGGIYGTKSPGFVIPGSFPYYFDRGEGCRLYDVDGNEFIDYLCGYGSMILGYGSEPIVAAGEARLRDGDLLTGPQPVMVDLAEMLVDRIDGMEWAVFAKNGTDATTLAVSIARVATEKPIVMIASHAYHGAANWCSSNEYPILRDRDEVVEFEYNDVDMVRRLFSRHAGRIAAVVVTPYHHPAFAPSVMPAPGWYDALHELCRSERSLLIMDDIRANFRLNRAGSHVEFGAHPDLICMGKSIANGSPLGVLLGSKAMKSTAASFFITGTFWTASAPMTMAVRTLEEMDRVDVIAHTRRVGELLCAGLTAAASESGFSITMSGPPSMPFMTFDEDPDLTLNQAFCALMARRGVYLHPHHNWFLSYAHRESDIETTVDRARVAFRALAAEL